MDQIHLLATGSPQDIQGLYANMIQGWLLQFRDRYEIMRDRQTLTATWDYGFPPFERIEQLGYSFPFLRLALAWRYERHQVGYCVYGAGVEELAEVETIRSPRHSIVLWKRAQQIAHGHTLLP
jgi:hypothetical protein